MARTTRLEQEGFLGGQAMGYTKEFEEMAEKAWRDAEPTMYPMAKLGIKISYTVLSAFVKLVREEAENPMISDIDPDIRTARAFDSICERFKLGEK